MISKENERHLWECRLPFEECPKCQEIEASSQIESEFEQETKEINSDNRIKRISYQKAYGQ